MLYSEKVMDHFRNPRNVGEMENPDGVGEVGNAKCGDIMRMYIKVDPKTNIITNVKFMTFGCGSPVLKIPMSSSLRANGQQISILIWLERQQALALKTMSMVQIEL